MSHAAWDVQNRRYSSDIQGLASERKPLNILASPTTKSNLTCDRHSVFPPKTQPPKFGAYSKKTSISNRSSNHKDPVSKHSSDSLLRPVNSRLWAKKSRQTLKYWPGLQETLPVCENLASFWCQKQKNSGWLHQVVPRIRQCWLPIVVGRSLNNNTWNPSTSQKLRFIAHTLSPWPTHVSTLCLRRSLKNIISHVLPEGFESLALTCKKLRILCKLFIPYHNECRSHFKYFSFTEAVLSPYNLRISWELNSQISTKPICGSLHPA